MKITEIHIEQRDALKQLMPLIKGKVFHVSMVCNWSNIEMAGEILPNDNGELQTSFGSSSNSYFKNKGCVSVFDYRKIHEEDPQKHMHKCSPTRPLTPEEGIVIFVLGQEYHNELESWDRWRHGDLSQMVVPHVEAGYPGPIELSKIEETIFVTMEESTSFQLIKALRAGRNTQD